MYKISGKLLTGLVTAALLTASISAPAFATTWSSEHENTSGNFDITQAVSQSVLQTQSREKVKMTIRARKAAIKSAIELDLKLKENGSGDELMEESDSISNYEIDFTAGKLNPINGMVDGPSGVETYYNLDMSVVISDMRYLGYSEEDYPYWIRKDGVKMFGGYVMVAADLETRPFGTILQTTLGEAIVVDTGDFIEEDPSQVDIAVDW